MKIRGFVVVLVVLAMLIAPIAVDAQQSGKAARIGILFLSSPASTSAALDAFRASLRDLGHVEGRTFTLEFRSAEGRAERLPELAAQLVERKVDLIITGGANVSTLAARKATTTTPIVMIGSVDAVEAGIVDSLARPGGNVTGLTVPRELGEKQLGLLRELVPSLSRLAILTRSDTVSAARRGEGQAALLALLGMTVEFIDVKEPADLPRAFASVRALRSNAMIVGADPLFFYQRDQVLDFARTARLPAMYPLRDFVDAGGLISYGPSIAEALRILARYVDKILKGVKPADLPVEQPTKFELFINMKTAKALGLTIPPSLLLRADQVIE